MVKKTESKQAPPLDAKLQARIDEREAIRAAQRKERVEQEATRQQHARNVAEKYLEESIAADETERQNKRTAKERGDFWVGDEPKVFLVVRIKGVNKLPPKVKKIFELFRLRQIHNAVLIKNNKATRNMLRRIEPYVTFGYPSKSLITKLVYRRGYVKINKQRVPINDNAMIEDHLGKFGLKCVEDLIHEVATCGPHFKEANNFIWTFKLKSPTGGFIHKRQSYINGGDWGNREDKISALVKRML